MWDAVSGGTQLQNIVLEGANHIWSVNSSTSDPNYYYDVGGNLAWAEGHSYTYDAENRLVSVDNGATASYKYDHQNRRVSKTVGSSTTHYVWQGSQVIAEHDPATPLPPWWEPPYQVQSARVDYVYAGSRMVYSRQRPNSSPTAWTDRYYLSDRLSTRVVLDFLGNMLGRQAHLPFGEDFAESGTQEKHHFTSYERDSETGTDYAVNRQYSQVTGRFQQADPYKASGHMLNPQSWNRYSYVQSDPVNFTDATGLFRSTWIPDPLPPELWPGWITEPSNPVSPPPDEKGWGGGGGGGASQQAPLPSNLRARLRKLLEKNHNECGNFTQNLINQVAKDTGKPLFSDYVLDLFNMINGPQGGGYLLQNLPKGVGGTPRGGMGNIGFPNATAPTVLISPIDVLSDFTYGTAQESYVHTALHETIHLAGARGNYSDRDLATAVFKLGGLSQREIADYNELDPDDVDANSRFWDKFLVKHCPQ